MSKAAIRHPVETITIGLESERPARVPANDDVAFALVSRFNVRMQVGKHPRWSHLDGRNLAESADYEAYWLRRLELFERVCIPSVVNLTPRPDAWFIAFGDVESWFVRELLDRLRPYPWIRPYFRAKGHADDAGPLPRLLSEFVQSLGKSFLCSTRFDSDDSLHGQFIGGLDRAISHLRERGYGDEQRCLNFLFGLLQTGGELSVFLRRNNMFQSVFEPADRIVGPYAGGHDEVRERMPLVEIVTNVPMWIYHRHDDTLEPGWATDRDRLSLTDSALHFPTFGLTTTMAGDERVGAIGATAAFPPDARTLRESTYWNAAQRGEAVDLAITRGHAAIARWIGIQDIEPADPVDVLVEFEGDNDPFLNSGHLARLGRELDGCGETGKALRLLDYAVFASPSDRHVRAERDALADNLAGTLDLDEQMDVLTASVSTTANPNAVVLVASGLSNRVDSDGLDDLREPAGHLARAGFAVTVLLVDGSGDQTAPEFPDDVLVETLDTGPGGSDVVHRAQLQRLARRVSDIGPSLLIADGSPVAQRLAAAVGRGLGIPVDFALPSGASSNDRTGVTP